MARTTHALAAPLAALLLAGCGYQPIGTFDRPEYRVQAASQGQHGLAFAPGSAEVSPEEAERLAAFLRQMAQAGLGEVIVSTRPTGSPTLDRQRLAAASQIAAAVGFPARLRSVDTRTPARPDPLPDVVLVEALRRGELLVACPGPSNDPLEEAYAGPLPRIGCSNAANLAHMAANRNDLIAPRPLGSSPAAVGVAAVERHRTGQVTSTPLASTR